MEPASLMNRSRRLEPALMGVACGLFSAVGYTAANTCLRAVVRCDPVWVSAVKAFPTLVLCAPWLLVVASRGERVFPPWRVLASLAGAGLAAQLCGNVMFQWSLGVIGIAVATPITLGAMILAGAILGRVFLGEPLTVRSALANLLLLAGILVLSLGARGASEANVAATDPGIMRAAMGAGAAFLSGIAFATLGVVIRYGVSGKARISTTIVSISFVGVVSLGLVTGTRIGLSGMLATPVEDLTMMILAGVFNAAAFLSLTKALQLTSVVLVNALNASQTAMALAVGVLLFQEPLTAALVGGVLLTAIGLLAMGGRRPKQIAEVKPQEEVNPRKDAA